MKAFRQVITGIWLLCTMAVPAAGQPWQGSSDTTGVLYRAGYVGIGTRTPLSRLHLRTTTSTDPLRLETTLATGFARVRYKSPSDEWVVGLHGEGGGDFRVENFYGGAWAGRLAVKRTGEVGIGTPLPAERLHVVGSILAQAGRSIVVGRAYGAYGVFGAGEHHTNPPESMVLSAMNRNYTNSAYIEVFRNTGGEGGDIALVAGSYEGVQGEIRMLMGGIQQFTLSHAGNVGIGTTNTAAHRLNVNGRVRANEIIVDTEGADFVFGPDYRLRPLEEVRRYIEAHGRLPEIPSAAEMRAAGMHVGALQVRLLQKIEELTLYVLAQEERLRELEVLRQRSGE